MVALVTWGAYHAAIPTTSPLRVGFSFSLNRGPSGVRMTGRSIYPVESLFAKRYGILVPLEEARATLYV